MYYGWKLLGALGTIYFLSIGTVFYGLAVTLPEMTETFGWARSEVGLGFSLATLSMGLSGPIIAWVIAKRGVRFSIMLGGFVAATGAINMFFTESLLQFYVTAPLLGIGIGLQTIIPGTQLVSNWFKRRRAIAIALFMASGGLGRAIITPLFAWIIETTGDWRLVWLIMAGGTLLASFIAFLMVRNSPADMGLLVDGVDDSAESEDENSTVRKSRVFQTDVDWTVKAAVKTRSFWMLVACSATGVMGGTLINSQGLLHLSDIGLDKITAASAIGLIGFLSTGGRLISGALGDYMEPKYMMGLGLFMLVIGMGFLTQATTPLAVYAFACIFGLGNGLAVVTTPTIMANYFGSQHYASLYAVRGLMTTVLSAMVPVTAGLVFDRLHSYNLVFMAYIGLASLAIVLVMFLKPPVAIDKPAESS
ncbi:MAG: MFS transporter [Pseudomonadales bacterium]|nr:MFS transporter [Pseudomonadales bacterium]